MTVVVGIVGEALVTSIPTTRLPNGVEPRQMECLVSDSGATREAGKALLGPFVCCCFLNGPINAHLWSRKVVKESQRSASAR